MYLTSDQILTLSEETLRNFLSLAIPEGLYLDYKEALSGKLGKEMKRKFLKDITAFANAAGGNLFLGVKEPIDGVSVDVQLIGLKDGNAIAQDLERLASTSVEPRISGLRIVPVLLANGNVCIAVHIPPSLSRPHMVNHEGHRSFYARHSESSFPMSTHEIREAVLTSTSAEARARNYIKSHLQEVQDLVGDRQAAFYLQAIPLISPESSWDVLSAPFENVLRGDERYKKYRYINLVNSIAPRPTIDGLLSQDQHEEPLWETEVHRTGYISLLYRDIRIQRVVEVDRFIVHSGICEIFRAFCHMLKEFLNVSATDVPYLITCAYLNAEGTCMLTESRGWPQFSGPYKKKNIFWPEHLCATGADPMTIAESLSLEMFNAFGFKKVVD